MALEISPRKELDSMLVGTNCLQTLDISKKLKTDTVASYSYKIYDSSDNEVTDTFGGGSSISSNIITFGIKAIEAGDYTIEFIITCNEVLPDRNTPREFYITMTMQIIATILVEEESAFIFDVQTTGASETFSLPLESSGTYNFNVDWGDSSDDDITVWNQAEVTHTYASAGTYEIKITGTIIGWRFNWSSDRSKIYEIKSWGPLNLGNNGDYFGGCSNFVITAIDSLNCPDTTNFYRGFSECTSLTSIPANLFKNCPAVTNFSDCFSWCTGLISIPSGLFDNCSLVTIFANCFYPCTSLLSIPSGLFDNCTLVTDFSYCFEGCTGINTDLPVDLILYNTEICACVGMFRDCASMTGDGTAFVDKAEEHGVVGHTNCFTGCTNLPDYNLIPADWGGGGA